jgi:hypothetical protein
MRPADAAGKTDYERVERHFLARCKRGLKPTVPEMRDYCRKNGLAVSERVLRRLKYRFRFVAIYTRPKKTNHFMQFAIAKYGSLMLDIGFYRGLDVGGGEVRRLGAAGDGRGAYNGEVRRILST